MNALNTAGLFANDSDTLFPRIVDGIQFRTETHWMTLLRVVGCLLLLCGICLSGKADAQAQKSDLRIMTIAANDYSTTTTILGRPITMYWSKATIFVKNDGNVASAACKLQLTHRRYPDFSTIKVYTANVPAIPAHTYVAVEILVSRFTADFADGTTDMFGFVDCANVINESNENNNTLRSGPGGIVS